MKLRTWLLKLIADKRNAMEALQTKSDASQDVEEVRAIGETLKTLKAEIEDAEAQLAALGDEGEGDAGTDDTQRSAEPNGVSMRDAQVVASFGVTQRQAEPENLQYRQAFMNFVLRNTPIPTELREDANTLTGDVAAAIPTQLVNQIIEKFDKVGMILPLVKSTAKASSLVAINTASKVPALI